jgi:peptide/nickel transport system permease protein
MADERREATVATAPLHEVPVRGLAAAVGARLAIARRAVRGPLARAGAVGIGVVLLVAALAPRLTSYAPTAVDLGKTLHPPSAGHLLGTDELGRDVLSRTLHGSRISLQAGMVSVGLALVAGVVLGLVSGYLGRWVDDLLMRAMDAILSFPYLVLALAITAALGPSLANAMVAIGVVYTPQFARLVRGQVLSVREREFVEAARALGARGARVVGTHIWPNVTAPIVVQAPLSMAFAIIAEASLSFLGLGVQPPAPSWGSMLRVGTGYIETAPWLALCPGVAIFLTVLAFNFFGDGVRDALDPRMRQ